jgi:ankyrin repeat protein
VAAENGFVELTTLLLGKGAAVDAEDKDLMTPLNHAAENGHLAVVRVLLEHGADMDAKRLLHGPPIVAAAENGHQDVVAVLLDRGANIAATAKVTVTFLLSSHTRRCPSRHRLSFARLAYR